MTTPPPGQYPEEFLQALKAVTKRRARIVIEHILQHGFITTEQLKDTYGYNEPRRAVADVRDEGIPLEKFTVRNAQGRPIAAYRFGDASALRTGFSGGRRQLPKKLKTALIRTNGLRCGVCREPFDAGYLQVDHRVPFRVAGEADTSRIEEWMLLCAACNRAKSWSCEHCANWLEMKDATLCQSCYWGSPDTYTHIALRVIRRLDIVWSEQQVENYERLKRRAQQADEPMPDFVKRILQRHLEQAESPEEGAGEA